MSPLSSDYGLAVSSTTDVVPTRRSTMSVGAWLRWPLWAGFAVVATSAVVGLVGILLLSLIARPDQFEFGIGYSALGGVIGAIIGVALAVSGTVSGGIAGALATVVGVRPGVVNWLMVAASAVAAGVVFAILAPTFPLPTVPVGLVCAVIGGAGAAFASRFVWRTRSVGSVGAQ